MGLVTHTQKLYLHQKQSVKKKQLQNCTVNKKKMDQFPETNNQPKVYILIPAELGKTYKFTIDCKIYRYLVKKIHILQFLF